MNYTIEEDRLKSLVLRILNVEFVGFDDIYYDWAEFNCGMGVCCDPYAIGFVLPQKDYDDYFFKLVDSQYYDNNGDYPISVSDNFPDVCMDTPDVTNPNFDTIIFYKDYLYEIQDMLGVNGVEMLLPTINEFFTCRATNILFI